MFLSVVGQTAGQRAQPGDRKPRPCGALSPVPPGSVWTGDAESHPLHVSSLRVKHRTAKKRLLDPDALL